jgi:hypothetical protein
MKSLGDFGALLFSQSANADTLFDFKFSTSPCGLFCGPPGTIFGGGTFTSQGDSGLVLTLSGEVNGMTITGFSGLASTSPDIAHLTLDFATGSVEVGAFHIVAGNVVSLFDTKGVLVSTQPAAFEDLGEVSQTPLPASAPLFGLALFVLAAFGFASKRLKPGLCSPALIVTADGSTPY